MLQTDHSMAEKTPPVASETPNPQVESKEPRRAFTTAYKLSILAQADRCENSGEIGALLRREGLYSSHLSNWRRLRREGTLQALEPKQRGPKAALRPAERRELEQLCRRNAQLEHELEKARTIIDVQKKLSVLLSNLPEDEPSS